MPHSNRELIDSVFDDANEYALNYITDSYKPRAALTTDGDVVISLGPYLPSGHYDRLSLYDLHVGITPKGRVNFGRTEVGTGWGASEDEPRAHTRTNLNQRWGNNVARSLVEY